MESKSECKASISINGIQELKHYNMHPKHDGLWYLVTLLRLQPATYIKICFTLGLLLHRYGILRKNKMNWIKHKKKYKRFKHLHSEKDKTHGFSSVNAVDTMFNCITQHLMRFFLSILLPKCHLKLYYTKDDNLMNLT